jgi:tetrapyrrole methylase family protein / MazG family protein
MSGITLLGLGPGDPAKLTREAWEVLASCKQLWLRTDQHPAVAGLPSHLKIHSFDDIYEKGESFDEVYYTIVEKVLGMGQTPEGVVYAVPGDPFVAEATCAEVVRRAKSIDLPVRIVNGISCLEPAFAALGLDPFPRLVLMDAIELSQAHVPVFPVDMPVIIAQIYSRLVAAEVKMTLNSTYPDEHPVSLVHAAGTGEEIVEHLQLYEIDCSEHIGMLSILYVPPLGEGTSMEAFQEIVAHLRAPDGCPWDREQTHSSLRTNLLEETYETLAAMDSGDPAGMKEEFGDLLLQIVLNAQIACEDGDFCMADILKGIHDKIIRRHPHVFGGLKLDGVEGVLLNWEKLKALERTNSEKPEKGLLDGVPIILPALSQAQEFQERTARVGFDWREIDGVLEKIAEEIREVRAANGEEELIHEIGDLFFAMVNLARWKNIDSESALRQTNNRFKERFAFIEQKASKMGKKPSDLSMDQMEQWWQEAKNTIG